MLVPVPQNKPVPIPNKYIPIPKNKYIDHAANHPKYAFQSGDSIEVIDKKVNKLIKKWYDAAVKDPILEQNNVVLNPKGIELSKLQTTKRIKLYEKTRALLDSMSNLYSDKAKWKRVYIQIHKAINAHSIEDSAKLALWVGQNSCPNWQNGEICFEDNIYIHLPYVGLEKLYTPKESFKPGEIDDTAFKKILSDAKKIMDTKANFSTLRDEVQQVLSFLSFEDLLEFHEVKEYSGLASEELVRRINHNELKLQDLVFLSKDCSLIKYFLGDYCNAVYNIDIAGTKPENMLNVNYSSLDVLYLNPIVELFPNLKYVSLQNYECDLSLLESCEKLESLSLEHCAYHNFDPAKLKNLKKIELRDGKAENFVLSEACPSVEILLCLNHFVNINYSLDCLKYYPNLKRFSITYVSEIAGDAFIHCQNIRDLALIACRELTDFSFFKHLPKLETLNLASAEMLTDDELLKIIEFCPKLTQIGLMGCDKVSDKLVEQLRKGTEMRAPIQIKGKPFKS
jgi:hypothetical protein